MPTKEIELILFQPYCKVAYCISLFPEHSSRTNDFVTIRKRYSVYGGLRCSPPFELRLHKVNGSHYSPGNGFSATTIMTTNCMMFDIN